MNFFILGDSWGVGEYKRVDGIVEPVADTGLGHWLQQSGHTVCNISKGNASNFGQLRKAYWDLKENHNYDYIVWFYTEPFRDIIETVMLDPVDGPIQYPDFTPDDFPRCHYITQQNLQYAQMIYDEFRIPFIVIGGQCRLPGEIDQYSFCYQKIHNWAAELLELDFDFPEYTWFAWSKFLEIFEYFGLDKKKFIIDENDNLDKVSTILQMSQNNPKFPDGRHPSRDEFRKLATRLLDEFLK